VFRRTPCVGLATFMHCIHILTFGLPRGGGCMQPPVFFFLEDFPETRRCTCWLLTCAYVGETILKKCCSLINPYTRRSQPISTHISASRRDRNDFLTAISMFSRSSNIMRSKECCMTKPEVEKSVWRFVNRKYSYLSLCR